jgi:cysteine desulfurase/selenocysteine lyase
MDHTIATETTQRPVTPLDAAAIRADFPVLNQVEEGRPRLAFLDSAASSQKPAAVIDALDDYYRRYNANIHRGVYHLSELATTRYEEARHLVADFIGAAAARECIFVRNTTEGINLVANAWGPANISAGDLILVSYLEHHSNLVPWHLLAERTGARIKGIPLTADLRLDLAAFEELLKDKPKLVAVTHVSNTTGTINDVKTIAAKAHGAGAVVLIDAAQSAPHLPLNVQEIDCDFLALSGHKMLGPMGSGVLYGKRALLDAMPPFMGGGGMIKKVRIDGSTYQDGPARYEAGTPAVGDAIGLGAAVEYLQAIGMERVREHERELTAYAMARLAEVPGLVQYGPADLDVRAGVISFTLGDIHAHDVAAILDSENVAVRAGHHCNQPLMDHLGIVATARASFSVYNTPEDVDQLVLALHKANRIFEIA